MQIIYYGAPGTGKSHLVNELISENNLEDSSVFRTTFHPEYTHNDFVGQLLPKVTKTEETSTITYEFSKGVFTKALEKAYEDTSKVVFLIIEEMSRGDCASIFGDIFQLLDRETSGVERGYSKYFISNDILSKDILAIYDDKVRLPPNLYLFGTVNSCDQNVFVMDTAFKRRFDWLYISTKPKPEGGPYVNNPIIKYYVEGNIEKSIKWVNLYGILNKFISDTRFLGLGEDKQIGQFFIEFDVRLTDNDVKNKIKNKLLNYLWSDVESLNYNSDIKIFESQITSFTDLYDAFETDKQIFSEKFIKCIGDWELNRL